MNHRRGSRDVGFGNADRVAYRRGGGRSRSRSSLPKRRRTLWHSTGACAKAEHALVLMPGSASASAFNFPACWKLNLGAAPDLGGAPLRKTRPPMPTGRPVPLSRRNRCPMEGWQGQAQWQAQRGCADSRPSRCPRMARWIWRHRWAVPLALPYGNWAGVTNDTRLPSRPA